MPPLFRWIRTRFKCRNRWSKEPELKKTLLHQAPRASPFAVHKAIGPLFGFSPVAVSILYSQSKGRKEMAQQPKGVVEMEVDEEACQPKVKEKATEEKCGIDPEKLKIETFDIGSFTLSELGFN
ncbi:hypothetical protein TNIN_84671 [Trichonephila inaurata madagascariensis]|uniref:Uncharacterized protein n=1 Tax=Trichonephila inaurata madagascariensis TaxID=2747483 RepID=A0A8X6XYN3_9ARAC|nr:hypothetical protein TNIN_84671 [Trichonephila inaurata madagascariensis]